MSLSGEKKKKIAFHKLTSHPQVKKRKRKCAQNINVLLLFLDCLKSLSASEIQYHSGCNAQFNTSVILPFSLDTPADIINVIL